MTFDRSTIIALASLLSLATAKADLTANLLAYYDFEQTGSAGLANKAPGASTYHATRGGSLHADWATGENPTGPGFAGKENYTSTTGSSDRSMTLGVGKVLNFDDDRNEYVEIPLGTAQLGNSFSISMWHALTPGDINPSGRYHAFESSTGYDVSWGTSPTSFTTPQTSYPYLAWIGTSASFGPAALDGVIWHNVVHSFSSDGTNTTLRLYVNGSFAGSRTVTTSTMSFPALFIGRQRSDSTDDREWDGMMDEVAVWDRALSANDAKELFLRGVETLAVTADLATANKGFVSVSSSNETMGTVIGTELYGIGAEASIEALPATGYAFTGWTGAFAGKPASFQHTVTGSVESVAKFAQDSADDDNDGLTNYEELLVYQTFPDDPDTDDDGINDGDEAKESLTNPLVSQQAAIDYILAHLDNGGIQPGDTVLARNPANNSLGFRLRARASTDPGAGAVIAPSVPGVSGAVANGELRVNLPASSDTKRFFIFDGVGP